MTSILSNRMRLLVLCVLLVFAHGVGLPFPAHELLSVGHDNNSVDNNRESNARGLFGAETEAQRRSLSGPTVLIAKSNLGRYIAMLPKPALIGERVGCQSFVSGQTKRNDVAKKKSGPKIPQTSRL